MAAATLLQHSPAWPSASRAAHGLTRGRPRLLLPHRGAISRRREQRSAGWGQRPETGGPGVLGPFCCQGRSTGHGDGQGGGLSPCSQGAASCRWAHCGPAVGGTAWLCCQRVSEGVADCGRTSAVPAGRTAVEGADPGPKIPSLPCSRYRKAARPTDRPGHSGTAPGREHAGGAVRG